jgi:hypothetical protein
MRCHEVQEAVVAGRYGGGALPADVTDHLAGCAECASFVRQSAALDGLLAADVDLPLRPGFDTRFRALLDEQKGQGRAAFWRWPRLAAAALGTALAAVLAVVTLGGRHPTPRGEAPPSDLAVAMNLELLENMEVVARLDEVEVLDLMSQAGPEALDAAIRETRSVQ